MEVPLGRYKTTKQFDPLNIHESSQQNGELVVGGGAKLGLNSLGAGSELVSGVPKWQREMMTITYIPIAFRTKIARLKPTVSVQPHFTTRRRGGLKLVEELFSMSIARELSSEEERIVDWWADESILLLGRLEERDQPSPQGRFCTSLSKPSSSISV